MEMLYLIKILQTILTSFKKKDLSHKYTWYSALASYKQQRPATYKMHNLLKQRPASPNIVSKYI